MKGIESQRQASLPATIAAWCTYVAIDFLAHAVFLAPYWRTTERYWLPPGELFRMIPLSYLVFAAYCAVLILLLRRLYGERLTLTAAVGFGTVAGFFYGASFALGSYCVFRMPASALIVWPASVTGESAGASIAAAWVLTSKHPWRRMLLVLAAAIFFFIAGAVLQSLFFPIPTDRLAA